MNLSNKLSELLDVDYPIVQAPMGGESTSEMAIAVSNAGGLGGAELFLFVDPGTNLPNYIYYREGAQYQALLQCLWHSSSELVGVEG